MSRDNDKLLANDIIWGVGNP